MPGAETLLLTRIWAGITGPLVIGPGEVEPGYMAVVGEVYDNDPRQKPRMKILLDEGSALNPDDFQSSVVEAHRELFYSTTTIEDDEGNLVPREVRRDEEPTLDDLRQVAVALKDIYFVHRNNPLLCLMPPNLGPMSQYLRSTEGFVFYSKRYDDEQFEKWFPTFRDRQRTAALHDEHPFGEDPDYAVQLVESLLVRDEFQAGSHCKLFWERSRKNPLRAVGMVCAAMQMMDWTFRIRRWQATDGYEMPASARDRDKVMREERQRLAVRLTNIGVG